MTAARLPGKRDAEELVVLMQSARRILTAGSWSVEADRLESYMFELYLRRVATILGDFAHLTSDPPHA